MTFVSRDCQASICLHVPRVSAFSLDAQRLPIFGRIRWNARFRHRSGCLCSLYRGNHVFFACQGIVCSLLDRNVERVMSNLGYTKFSSDQRLTFIFLVLLLFFIFLLRLRFCKISGIIRKARLSFEIRS